MGVQLYDILMALSLMNDGVFDSLDPKEVTCLAQNIYHESRGEPVIGQMAVAHVTMNRVRQDGFPDSICAVVYQKNKKGQQQFSWTVNAPIPIKEPAAFDRAMIVALAVMTGMSSDPTNGATFFFDHSVATPGWSRSFTTTAIIGEHTFQRNDAL